MKKHILLAFLLTWVAQINATETVRVRTDVDFVITGTTTSTLSIYSEKASGDGTAETAPFKFYVPMQNDGSANAGVANNRYHISTPTTVFNASTTTHVANIPLRISTPGGVDRYLYAAVKDTTDSNRFKPIKMYGTGPVGQGLTNSDITFAFSPADICNKLPSDQCRDLLVSSTSETDKSFIVYFFLSPDASYGPSDSIDPAALNNGIYFQVYMSNRVYSDSDLRISITETKNGDKRVILVYSASSTVSSSTAKSVRVYLHDGAPSAQNEPLASYSGSILTEEYPYQQNSEVTVSGLTNGTSPRLSLFFLDKYYFGTTLSADVVGSPKEIQELLKEQSCFLLTAGFGEEHYVIQYFRNFRDNVLAKNVLGRMFISTYYELAPKYALMIYEHEMIRSLIRGCAYTLYFLFNHLSMILIILIAGFIGTFLFKKREKIKI